MTALTPFARTARRHAVLGLTLVELLVAIGVGGLLVAGSIRIFISNREAYEYNNALSEVQDVGRVAIDLITRDLRHAGQFGCGGDDVYNLVNTSVSVDDSARLGELDFIGAPGKVSPSGLAAGGIMDAWVGLAVEGFDNAASGSTWLPSGADVGVSVRDVGTTRSVQPIAGSDGITLRYLQPSNRYESVAASGDGRQVTFTYTANATSADDRERALNERGAAAGARMGLSDCGSAHMFTVAARSVTSTGDDSSEVTLDLPTGDRIDKPYGAAADSERAQLGQLVAVRYLIAPGRLDPARRAGDTTTRVPTLYRVTLGNPLGNNGAERLVEGVEDLQLLYGFDVDGDAEADEYVDAATLNASTPAPPARTSATDHFLNWMNVTSVRIALLVRSSRPLAGTPGNQPASTFATLARFREPTEATPSPITFDCSATAGGNDPCRYRRRVLVATAAVRNL